MTERCPASVGVSKLLQTLEKLRSDQFDHLTRLVHIMIADLANSKSIAIHSRISQFYYMQKAEELKILRRQLDEAQQKLENIQGRAQEHYREIYYQWKSDVRWIKKTII